MALQIGEMAPDFAAQTTLGDIRFYDWMGDSWAVMLTYPKDFTPVCAAEIRIVETLAADFESRGCKFVGLCVDALHDMDGWSAGISAAVGQPPHFPLVGDPDLRVATLYDAVPKNARDARTMRSLMVIGPDKRVKLVVAYPMATPSIFSEVLRLIESLQADGQPPKAKVVNWRRNGADPTVDDLGIVCRNTPKRHFC